MLLIGEMALDDSDQHDGQNQRANDHVDAMKARQNKKVAPKIPASRVIP